MGESTRTVCISDRAPSTDDSSILIDQDIPAQRTPICSNQASTHKLGVRLAVDAY